jgi:hypothetical protein
MRAHDLHHDEYRRERIFAVALFHTNENSSKGFSSLHKEQGLAWR